MAFSLGATHYLGGFQTELEAAHAYDAATRPFKAAPAKLRASRYTGVSWYRAYGKWQAMISLDGKRRHLGYFDSETDAAKAYDAAAAKREPSYAQRGGKTSAYTGVSWYAGYEKWRASITVGKKYVHLGYFADEIAAAKAYDNAVRALALGMDARALQDGRPGARPAPTTRPCERSPFCNRGYKHQGFGGRCNSILKTIPPLETLTANGDDDNDDDNAAEDGGRGGREGGGARGGRSRFTGVHYNRSKDKYEASIRHKCKKIYLGIYKDERDAAKAYDASISVAQPPW